MNLSREVEIIFDSLCASSDNYIFVYDMVNKTWKWSPNTYEMFNLDKSAENENYGEVVIKKWTESIHPDDRCIFENDIGKIFSGENSIHNCEYRIFNRAGEYISVRCRGKAHSDEKGRPCVFAGIVRPCQEHDRFDPLTNVLNLNKYRDAMYSICEGGGHIGGTMIIGIDKFKKINTLYSYTAGNTVMYCFAQLLKDLCPGGSDLYRLEGDKFAYIDTKATEEKFRKLFDDINSSIHPLKLGEDMELELNVSGGIVMFDEEQHKNVDDVIRNLLDTLAESKDTGEGTLTVFNKEMSIKRVASFKLWDDLRDSVNNDFQYFEVFYQPIHSGDTGQLTGCEALLRWHCPNHPNVYPDKFIPILEESGLILKVGRWVITKVLEQMKKWREVYSSMRVNVNMSYVQLNDETLFDFIQSELERLELPPEVLTIELTESCEVRNLESVRDLIIKLRSAGISFALDDFGTGYASLSILRDLPTDWVKIDHTFVSKINDQELDRSMIEYIIKMCHSLDVSVCVEGVENETSCGIVRGLQPESIQGYYYSRPVAPDLFESNYFN